MILAKCCHFTLQREGKFWKRKLLVSFGRNDDSKRKKNPSGWQESSVDTPTLGCTSPHCCSDVDGRRIHPPASSPFLLRTLLSHREPSWVSATRAVDHRGRAITQEKDCPSPGSCGTMPPPARKQLPSDVTRCPGTAQDPCGKPTFLDGVLEVVDDGGQDGGQAHHLRALRQAQREQLVPAGAHQAGVAVLPANHTANSTGLHYPTCNYVNCNN